MKPTQPLFKDVAFVIYPVTNMATARTFYEDTLGLTQTANWQDQWIEYDIGHGTLAIALADEKHKAGAHGPSIGLEVTDWDVVVSHVKQAGIRLVNELFDTPVCRGCIIADPDGNEILLHNKK